MLRAGPCATSHQLQARRVRRRPVRAYFLYFFFACFHLRRSSVLYTMLSRTHPARVRAHPQPTRHVVPS
ncbi:hypothetical protein HETIRDRAFT_167726 [Heterobasidion irregulare TC 32-1]|uniref:Uncharacterized protein n=1 Tax=Heterobasidion irregulare (strain TC 32-1) TaxID=747525 RepID=W4KJN4_HETIT|nr:uncharacterized protein HETIRDRAFT_167726 [Heterobasidion irregulare TC 32-1]ETW86062.1 hypothetical protein HETIRDRAFT_167726 [Heterobasidion irregulare TC 32-1]